MNKKMCFLFCSAVVLIIFSSGCQTSKGIATGIKATAQGVSNGVYHDVKNAWQTTLKADDWMKKNLW